MKHFTCYKTNKKPAIKTCMQLCSKPCKEMKDHSKNKQGKRFYGLDRITPYGPESLR